MIDLSLLVLSQRWHIHTVFPSTTLLLIEFDIRLSSSMKNKWWEHHFACCHEYLVQFRRANYNKFGWSFLVVSLALHIRSFFYLLGQLHLWNTQFLKSIYWANNTQNKLNWTLIHVVIFFKMHLKSLPCFLCLSTVDALIHSISHMFSLHVAS